MSVHPSILIPPSGAEPADEWVRLGMAAHNQGDYVKAEAHARQALRLDPRHPAALNNVAITYACGGDYNEALLAADRAILLGPAEGDEAAVIRANKAMIASEAKRHDEAVAAIETALPIAERGKESLKTVRLAAAHVYGGAGMPGKAAHYYALLADADPGHFPAGQNLCFALTLTDSGPEEGQKRRRAYAAAHRQPSTAGPHHQLSLNGHPIRVGYVSGDYKRHSASMIWGAVVLHHTPAVEAYLYSTMSVSGDTDICTKRFVDSAGPRWRDLTNVPDDKAEALIKADKIDILVDLAGHTGGGRLPLFTRKLAPVQVTAWGFAHGTGCPEIDYFFADPVAVPSDERRHYAEEIVDLPCIVTYDPPSDYGLRGTSRPPVVLNEYFTFGCYCRWEKVSDAYLDCVRAILLAVPDSRMLFKDDAYRRPDCCKRVLSRVCTPHGVDESGRIDPARILFSGGTTHPDHLLSYQQSDLILDPFPHSGGLAALEQLYMGVPLVTLYGKQAAGRTAASVLTCLDRTDWITYDFRSYTGRAINLAGTEEGHLELAGARKTLRKGLLDSLVCKGYVAAVEEKYHWMVQQKAVAYA